MRFNKLLVSMLLFLVVIGAGCEEKIEPGNTRLQTGPVVRAAAATARLTLQPLLYEAVGTVEARTASTLSSKLMGTVKAVHVREGDRFKKGDVLIVLDKRQVSAQLQRAQAAVAEAKGAQAAALSALEAARAGAELGRTTYRRYQELIKDESASPQEFDEVKARYRRAQADLQRAAEMARAARYRVQEAKAAVAAATVRHADSVIAAPYDGTVTAKLVQAGDLAAPGTPLLTLEEGRSFRVDVVLPETYFKLVNLAQKVRARIPAARVEPFEGRIETIVPAADRSSRSFSVKVSLPADPAIHSGMFARVAIVTGVEKMLLIPAAAVVVQGQLTAIFILDAQKTARFRLIRTGRIFDNGVEVISGLMEGERFVVRLPDRLEDGVRVEVAP